MRPLKLSLEAFGPYPGLEEIDFDALREAGLFVVAGPTGSGKSSLFDALCFALYGRLAGARQSAKAIRSDHASPSSACEVILEFLAHGDSWRVSRSPSYEREKKRGSGTTTALAKAVLEKMTDGTWQGVESKRDEVDSRCRELVGLDFEQFQRVILLPQGGFSQVLNAKSDERQQLLRTLFSTEAFDVATTRLKESASEASGSLKADQLVVEDRVQQARASLLSAMAAASVEIDIPEERSTSALEAALNEQLLPLIGEMKLELEALALSESSSRSNLEKARKITEFQQRLSTLKGNASKLETEKRSVETKSAQIERARLAGPIRSQVAALNEATDAVNASRQSETSVRLRLEAGIEGLSLPASLDAAYILNFAARIKAEGDRFTLLLQTRMKLDDEQVAQVETKNALLASIEGRKVGESQLLAAAEKRSLVEAMVLAGENAAKTLPKLEASHKIVVSTAQNHERLLDIQIQILGAEAQLKAFDDEQSHRIMGIDFRLAGAVQQIETSSELLRQAEDSYEQTLRAFIKSTAPRLAAELQNGEACPVCGSKAHPSPASPDTSDLPGIDALQLAQDVLDSANRNVREAEGARLQLADSLEKAKLPNSSHIEIRDSIIALRSQNGVLVSGLGEVALYNEIEMNNEIASSQSELELVRNSVSTLRLYNDELDELDIAIRQQKMALAEEAARQDEQGAALEESRLRLNKAFEQHSGELAGNDPQTKRDEAVSQGEDVRQLASLVEDRTALEATTEACRSLLQTALASSPFKHGDEAEAAGLDERMLAKLEGQVASWQKEYAETTALVEDLEAMSLPDELPDLEGLMTLSKEATESREAKATILATTQTHANLLIENLKDLVALKSETAEARNLAEQLKEVADVCAGRNGRRISLEAWVLGAYLREVVSQANLHLEPMSSGRYRLAVSQTTDDRRSNSGLDLVVEDAHTGRSRAASSLSGGETFQASLSLALGLADVVTAGRSGLELDCVFIDEGFGSLDPDALDLAIDVLDGLRSRGSLVGIVTHVSALKEALQLGIEVKAIANGGGSTIKQLV